MKYYNVNEDTVIQCDASESGLSATLLCMREAPNYIDTTERNYAQIEKEIEAILFACKRFDK